MKKIITIIGARPQIIKSSAINRAIRTDFSNALEEVIIHTGQHYDNNMSAIFMDEMEIDRPRYNLEVGSGTHASQTAEMMQKLEEIFFIEKPDAVLVYGDTNSTVAGALAAAKIGIPVIHVEAGLRSFDKQMPEEINRISCDHMSTLLFSPTQTGVNNLGNEGFKIGEFEKVGINSPAVFHCGDVMFDNSLYFSEKSDTNSRILEDLNLKSDNYILCTIHRDSNTDNVERLSDIFKALIRIAKEKGQEIVLPLHPRTKNKMEDLDFLLVEEIESSIKLIDPVSFIDIIALEKNSRLIITDSGGLQKEAYFFNKPCVVLRPHTEWVEIVDAGGAVLADANEELIYNYVNEFLSNKNINFSEQLYGDGNSAKFICQKIIDLL